MDKNDEMQTARELMNRGWGARREGRMDEARGKLEEAITLCRRIGARQEMVTVLGKLAPLSQLGVIFDLSR